MSDTQRFSIPVLSGTVAGLGVWILGYLVTALLASEETRGDPTVALFRMVTDDPGDWQLAGLLYYNAHSVDITFPDVALAPERYNYVAGAEGLLTVLFFLPPVVLVIAGGLVTARSRDDLRRLTDGLVSGATVTVGYLALTVLGLLLFAIEAGDGTVRPDPLVAVFVAGILYPAVFGSLGGILTWLLTRGSSAESSS